MNAIKLAEGIYYNVDPNEYHKLGTATTEGGIPYTIPSKSTISKAYKDYAKWKASPPFKKTAAMDEGSLLDLLTLTPNLFARDTVKKKFDAYRTNEAKAWRDKMMADDKIIVQHGVEVYVPKKAFVFLAGTVLDFSDGLNGKGFEFANPNAAKTCGCGTSFSV